MKSIFTIKLIGIAILFSSSSAIVYAQESQSLSVTPPLFQLTVLPGTTWQSSVKVVNGNNYPLTVYAEVVNFQAQGESGQGKFLPLLNQESDPSTLARWIQISSESIVISPEQTVEVPFSVVVPNDAPPGGHYAAILISTAPGGGNTDTPEVPTVTTSQVVTSLFFARIEGGVEENANIREFSVVKSFLQKPEAEFSLRFENKGNVHLQPQGNIIITNMWGTERGNIPVNYQTHFGNVLPKTIRDFKFAWQSEFSITDIGRYTAIATLAYGEDGIKSTSSETHFWVIPVKGTLITLSVLALCIWLIVKMVQLYVRRMLALAGVPVYAEHEKDTHIQNEENISHKTAKTYRVVSAPLRDGVLDLRQRLSATDESRHTIKTIIGFIINYKRFFISILLLICIFVGVTLYIDSATDENSNYTVIIDNGGSKTTIEGGDTE